MSAMRGFERDTLLVAWRAKRVWLTDFFVNLVLLATLYGWLLIPERRAWHVVASGLLAVLWITAALWLVAATLQFFTAAHAAPESWGMSWRRSARSIPGLAVCCLVWALVAWLLLWPILHNPQLAGWLRHILPGPMRARISVSAIMGVIHWTFGPLCLLISPLFFLPFLREGAIIGFGALVRGWGAAGRSFWHLRWWIFAIVVLVVTVHLSSALMNARPVDVSLAHQIVRVVVRFAAAYILIVTAWMLLASALGRLRRAGAEPVADVKSEPMPIESAPKI